MPGSLSMIVTLLYSNTLRRKLIQARILEYPDEQTIQLGSERDAMENKRKHNVSQTPDSRLKKQQCSFPYFTQERLPNLENLDSKDGSDGAGGLLSLKKSQSATAD